MHFPDPPTLGALPAADETRRDAVHVAIVPGVARVELAPGAKVVFAGLVNTTEYAGPLRAAHTAAPAFRPAGPGETPDGVVDPFLAEPVPAGAKFWLGLYPNTTVGLRHVYNHPLLDRVAAAVRAQAAARPGDAP